MAKSKKMIVESPTIQNDNTDKRENIEKIDNNVANSPISKIAESKESIFFNNLTMTELLSYFKSLKELLRYYGNLMESNRVYQPDFSNNCLEKIATLTKYENAIREEMEKRILDLKISK